MVDFVLDFDACKSVVKRGNSGKYNLKPVVAVIPLLSDAGLRVIGYVAPSIASGATSVSVQTDGVPVKATAPDANGLFVLYPVPVGSYTLVVSAPGRVTAVITGVPVVDTAQTVVNSSALPHRSAAGHATAGDGRCHTLRRQRACAADAQRRARRRGGLGIGRCADRRFRLRVAHRSASAHQLCRDWPVLAGLFQRCGCRRPLHHRSRGRGRGEDSNH